MMQHPHAEQKEKVITKTYKIKDIFENAPQNKKSKIINKVKKISPVKKTMKFL